jgi:hypothetical protein
MKIDDFVRFLEKETDAIEVQRTYIDDYIFGKWWKYFVDVFGFDVGFGQVCAPKR